ncbi:MAG: histidine-type phosphatase [Mogibacterium sp.]|nr:histidine-type phosphatase [Mogibacterium sp.]MBP3897993.1 histidine-type phosphatase [Mogibacterium sp.]
MKENSASGIKKKLRSLLMAAAVVLVCMLLVGGLSLFGVVKPAVQQPETSDIPGDLSHEGYTLEKVVVLSRHNIRSPLSGNDSVLGRITPHEWYQWSSPASQLSVRGGTLETCMGQYFRKWLEKEDLFTENYRPDEETVRIYANSKQRTIATAEFFSAGLMPTANEDVEYHVEFDEMDPVFTPQITYLSDEYKKAATEQIEEMYSDDIQSLGDNYELVSDVIDMEDSEAWKDGTVTEFKTDDTKVILEEGKEPAMEGSLKTACSVSDAMVLQYYEDKDAKEAAFGNDLSDKDWEDISEIKDVYVDTLFSAPLIATNVAHPLLQEIQSEMDEEDREFTFLCGHDSNVASVLAALGAEEYELPCTIEKRTPIGCKLVFSKWESAEGKDYWSADLVYQTTEQLRGMELLDEENHPAIYPVSLKGVKKNDDGLYTEEAFEKRLDDAIKEYDRL